CARGRADHRYAYPLTRQTTRARDADYTLTPYSLVFRIRLLAVLAGQDFLGNEPGVLAHRGLDFGGHVGILLEEGFGVFAPLADALAVIGEPGAGFLHHAGLHAQVD